MAPGAAALTTPASTYTPRSPALSQRTPMLEMACVVQASGDKVVRVHCMKLMLAHYAAVVLIMGMSVNSCPPLTWPLVQVSLSPYLHPWKERAAPCPWYRSHA